MNRLFFSKRALAFLIAPAFLMAFVRPADKANFSGNWSLNESKSELGEFGGRFAARKIKVDQKDDAITIAKTAPSMNGEDVTNTETLTFDGKTVETTGFFNSKKKSVLKWTEDSQSFTDNYTIAFERDGQTTEITGSETWSLSNEGKTLTVQVSSTSSRGEFSMKAVYDKE